MEVDVEERFVEDTGSQNVMSGEDGHKLTNDGRRKVEANWKDESKPLVLGIVAFFSSSGGDLGLIPATKGGGQRPVRPVLVKSLKFGEVMLRDKYMMSAFGWT